MIGHNASDRLHFAAARLEDPVLSWIAVDSSKPGRDGKPRLVIHSRNDWAENFLDADHEWVKATMLKALADITGQDFSGALWSDLHRWRFANVDRAIGKPYLFDAETGLAACGDWCLGNRVEAAFESGRSLGQAVKKWIAA
jgi:predicted NAD/FAD-dependent oxidoreductase